MAAAVPVNEISVLRFSASRAKEIAALSDLIENPTGTKLIFQKLPCHMRRRAMSHNPKRMPRALREAHISQMSKSGPIHQPKRPRRKYRRRPSRLLAEYKKRSSHHKWLETHIWHAKRFHMTLEFGYHLPERSCARSHRFCYRSVTQHCILMDVSYLCCIELQGPQEIILAGLAKLCNPQVGLTFASVAFLKGTYEGRVLVFPSSGGENPIGLVTYLWRPAEDTSTTAQRTIWIWSHPAFSDQFLQELQIVFESCPVQVLSLKGGLNRFRLRGPKAHQVAMALLDRDRETHLLGPHLPPAYVTGVEVRDPRANLHLLRSGKFKDGSTGSLPCGVTGSSQSQLWDAVVREEVSRIRETIPDHIVNKRRAELLVPGSELPVQPDEKPIPILIINAPREGDNQSGSPPGCDIILPAGWGTAFWLALVYSGGHAGGLKDAACMNSERGICRDLCLEVDSLAGRQAAEIRSKKLIEVYFRRPPKNRTNYIKLATPCPFGVDWNRLVTIWSGQECQAASVLRDRSVLRALATNSSDADLPPGLLAVTVRLPHGCPQEFAMICLPMADQDEPERAVIREPMHKDPAAKERKALRQQHKKDLARLAKKRKEDASGRASHSSTEIVAAYKEKIRSLWMPQPGDFKTAYARPIVGFVVQGDFALSEGGGKGHGYIATRSLVSLSSKPRRVLVRNPGTDLYMWASLELDLIH